MTYKSNDIDIRSVGFDGFVAIISQASVIRSAISGPSEQVVEDAAKVVIDLVDAGTYSW